MLHGKPILVNGFRNWECNSFLYRDETTDSMKYILDDSNPIYKALRSANNENILTLINETDRLERVYGIGYHFKFKSDDTIYTFIDNSYGLAGTGFVIEYPHLLVEETAVTDLDHLDMLLDLTSNDISEILNNTAYDDEFGKTFYISSNRKSIYVSGWCSSAFVFKPTLILDTTQLNGIIDKVYELKGGNLIILLTNGTLLFWGEDNTCKITSPNDINYEGKNKLIKLDDGVQELYAINSCIIYRKVDTGYYYAGYCDDEISTYPFTIDSRPGEACPYPGIPLRHYPFDDLSAIKKMMFLKHGIAVLNDHDELNITGKDQRNNIRDAKVILQDTDVEDILYTDGYVVAYKTKRDNRIRLSDGNVLNNYIMRAHKYHPSIALL